jgi:tetratricopeptide (TPR) repeat protein
VDQSLVHRQPDVDGRTRLRLLEPVRQYAERRLAADPATASDVADRHARHFARVAQDAYEVLHGPGLIGQLDRLDADRANLRVAWARLRDTGRAGEAALALHGVWLYLGIRGHAREGLAWADALAPEPLDHAARCALHAAAAGLLFVTGDVPRMRTEATAALELARRLDDDRLVAEAAFLAGSAHAFAGDLPAAAPLLDEAADRARSSAAAWLEPPVLTARAQVALLGGRLDEARRVAAQAVRAARDLGNAFTLAVALNVRSTITELDGDVRASALLLAEATELSVRAGSRWTLVYALPGLAAVAARLGEAETAVRLFAASASLTASHAVDLHFPTSRALSDAGLSAVRERLGEEAFRRAWDEGRSLGAAETLELAARLTLRARA